MAENHDDEFYARRMRDHEAAWRRGDARALSDVVGICGSYRRPLPQWARDGVRAFVEHHRSKPSKRDRIHYTRWDAVQEIRDRKDELSSLGYGTKWTDGAVFETASEALAGTEAAGSPDTVRASYMLVQRLMKSGEGDDRFRL